MEQIKRSQRFLWLDLAKAIAMIAVVFSHEFASVKPLVFLCNSFMLPLFFLVFWLMLVETRWSSLHFTCPSSFIAKSY